MSQPENPFASPLADLQSNPAAPDSQAEAEQIRRTYLRHESSICTIGWLYFVCGGVTVTMAIIATVYICLTTRLSRLDLVLFVVIYVIMATLFFRLGISLRRLDRRVKIPIAILSVFGFIGFPPAGAIINSYILYLVFSKKGKMVFSREYQEVIRLTPQIKRRASKTAWTLIILFMVYFAVGCALGIRHEMSTPGNRLNSVDQGGQMAGQHVA